MAVSRGPLYICSYCDQLWYKYSVVKAERLRVSNPNAGKYLLSKKSVNDIEWICQSCDKNLKKNKIPPCAAMNGITFPVKPDFFDLNKLGCRLLAPRLAFKILKSTSWLTSLFRESKKRYLCNDQTTRACYFIL